MSLRAICDNNKSLILQIIPRLGLDEIEVERIVDSACKETPKGLSKAMQEVLGALMPRSLRLRQSARLTNGYGIGANR